MTNKNMVGEISGSHGGEYEDTVFWDVAPCHLVEVYRHFRGAFCLHHQGDRISEMSVTSAKLHGAESQKTVIFVRKVFRCVF
jgi:hypothetical protein